MVLTARKWRGVYLRVPEERPVGETREFSLLSFSFNFNFSLYSPYYTILLHSFLYPSYSIPNLITPAHRLRRKRLPRPLPHHRRPRPHDPQLQPPHPLPTR